MTDPAITGPFAGDGVADEVDPARLTDWVDEGVDAAADKEREVNIRGRVADVGRASAVDVLCVDRGCEEDTDVVELGPRGGDGEDAPTADV